MGWFFRDKRAVPEKCKHTWQTVNGMRKHEAQHIGEGFKGPMPYQVIGDTWIENRVCLKCHEVDDALDSYIRRVERQTAARKAREAEAQEIYAKHKGTQNP